LLAGIVALSLGAYVAENQEYSYSIRDALKISAWVLNENIDNNGYWTDDEDIALIIGHGYWTENGGRIISSDDEDVFVLDQLKLHEVRTMAPLSYMTMQNINIFVEFDGVIGVETEDEYIELSYSAKTPSAPMGGGGGHFYGNIKMPFEVTANVCPLDEYSLTASGKVRNTAKIGNEYYLSVNAYEFGNEQTPIIRAQLELAVIEDKTLPPGQDFFGLPRDKSSRFLSIELISYDYSDRYRLIDEIWDEETEDD
jgi:hypothetical protein